MQPLEFNAHNFFNRLIFHPDEGKNESDRREAWIATILIGIFTACIAHLVVGVVSNRMLFL